MNVTNLKVKVGDLVKLDCSSLINNTRQSSPIIGIVTQVFDALFEDGTEGNLEIDIKFGPTGWIRYKPYKDGGSLEVIQKERNND